MLNGQEAILDANPYKRTIFSLKFFEFLLSFFSSPCIRTVRKCIQIDNTTHTSFKGRVSHSLTTKRSSVIGQLLICKGCCCGKTENGHPPVPVDSIKQIWKENKFNKDFQLTISGCLGPCDIPNVASILSPDRNIWLGKLTTTTHYESLLSWISECIRERSIQELPDDLKALEFDRFSLPITVNHER